MSIIFLTPNFGPQYSGNTDQVNLKTVFIFSVFHEVLVKRTVQVKCSCFTFFNSLSLFTYNVA